MMSQILLIRAGQGVIGDHRGHKFGYVTVPDDIRAVEFGGAVFIDTGRTVRVFEQTEIQVVSVVSHDGRGQ